MVTTEIPIREKRVQHVTVFFNDFSLTFHVGETLDMLDILNGIHEVSGSIPLGSTTNSPVRS